MRRHTSPEALIAAARAVRQSAHAPYSKFRVGAAVADESGRIHVGCNVENASYGLTICAERNAIAAAVAAGARRVVAAAVASGSRPPASPCGACRQVLAEFASPGAPVFIAGPSGDPAQTSVGALLPLTFTFRAPPTSRRRR
ncbi:MAG TPA: cytidine deaminase [Polyangia bacterium]|nr:cytidine deaminase [Polyangia bacterium]